MDERLILDMTSPLNIFQLCTKHLLKIELFLLTIQLRETLDKEMLTRHPALNRRISPKRLSQLASVQLEAVRTISRCCIRRRFHSALERIKTLSLMLMLSFLQTVSVMSSRQYKLAETINHICSSSFSCNFPQVFLLSRWYSHKSSSMIRSLLISSLSLS